MTQKKPLLDRAVNIQALFVLCLYRALICLDLSVPSVVIFFFLHLSPGHSRGAGVRTVFYRFPRFAAVFTVSAVIQSFWRERLSGWLQALGGSRQTSD
jgi:hypothetical protein